jgi:tetratricopeptide (TPR) repeat protein
VLVLTGAAFGGALAGDFVYDDRFQVLRNPTLSSWAGVPRAFTGAVWQFMSPGAENGPAGQYYRPLFNATLVVCRQLFGFHVAGWHALSLVLHLTVTALVAVLARRWGIGRLGALGATLVFGLHPVHSESVAWVSGLPDVLAAVLLLPALLLYEAARATHARATARLLASALLVLAACFAKETALAFPLFVAVRELLTAGRDEAHGRARARRAWRALARTAPYAAAAAVYLAARLAVLGFLATTDARAAAAGAREVALTLPVVLARYARSWLLPLDLAITYDVPWVRSVAEPRLLLALVALGILGSALLVAARRSQTVSLALAWTMLFLLPALHLKALNPHESLLHDRYLYLPSVGLAVLAGAGLEALARRAGRRAAAVTALATAVALAALTVRQNRIWRDEDTLAAAALDANPASPFFHNYLGALRFLQGRSAEAAAAYREALRLHPGYGDAWSNLGDVHLRSGDPAAAARAYAAARRHGAQYSQTLYNHSVALTALRRYGEAEQSVLRALAAQPAHPDGWYQLGWVRQAQGDLGGAEAAHREALARHPEHLAASINRTEVLRRLGRPADAVKQAEATLARGLSHPALLFQLAEAHRQLGACERAVPILRQLQAQSPQEAALAASLSACGEGATKAPSSLPGSPSRR